MTVSIKALCQGVMDELPAPICGLSVTGVECRPEGVARGNVFVAIEEYLRYNQWMDGRAFMDEAIANGAAAIIGDFPGALPGCPIPVLHHPTPRALLGCLAARWYGLDSAPMPLIGVTGTNGKTTTSLLIHHIVHHCGHSVGCIGTLGVFHDGWKLQEGIYTTPLSLDTCRHLHMLRARGARLTTLEVSSHALALQRMSGLPLQVAVVTNVTRDHIDFHRSEEAYIAAKLNLLKLLSIDGVAVLNADDLHFRSFEACNTARMLSYGIQNEADLRAFNITAQPDGSTFSFLYQGKAYPVATRLIGRFQVYNILAAIAAAIAMGTPAEQAAAAVSTFAPVPGRMESYRLPNGAHALVDFAHNPDGLRNLLENCAPMRQAKLLLVFGCGGDRDKGKRPIMGAIGAHYADQCWLTSDNPRTESPERIIDNIREGIPEWNLAKIHLEPDRRLAIRAAYAASAAGDLIVIAGKGHEDYMIFGHTRHPYSDKAEILAICAQVNRQ